MVVDEVPAAVGIFVGDGLGFLVGLTVCGVVVTVKNLNDLSSSISLSFDDARLVSRRWLTWLRSRPAEEVAVILNLISESYPSSSSLL